MSNFYKSYPPPPYGNGPGNNPYNSYPYPPRSPYGGPPMYNPPYSDPYIELKDYGGKPFVINIDEATKMNNNFRLALWTGKHLQVTLMSIMPGEDIGLEIHPDIDQFLRIEQGMGTVKMGDRKDRLNYCRNVSDDDAIMIPAGTWHNLINTGRMPLKLYSIYAPSTASVLVQFTRPRQTLKRLKETIGIKYKSTNLY